MPPLRRPSPRPSSPEPARRLSLRDLDFDPAACTATRAGHEIALSARECALLRALMLNADRVLSRGQLERWLWPAGRPIDSNAVEVHVHHLRRKLGRGLIETVRGLGYVLRRDGEPAPPR